MAELSLCMIVKNEADVIARCLACVADVCDEIVIADTGSTDATKEICAQFTDKVYDCEWTDDFAAARNFSFAKATKPYVMWLDADDVLTAENVGRLQELKTTLDAETPDTVMCKYVTARGADGTPSFAYYRERVFRRAASPSWQGFVHECVAPVGKTIYSDLEIDHAKIKAGNPRRNLEIYQKKIADGAKLDGRDKFYYGRELFYNKLYVEAICVLENYLSDGRIWAVNAVEACSVLSDCYAASGDDRRATEALCRSFGFGAPRAETVCKIGSLFRGKDDRHAAFWYQAALNCESDLAAGGFCEPDCMDFIPYVELSCCYYRLGDKARAKKYHELAKSVHPTHPSVIYNEQYFAD